MLKLGDSDYWLAISTGGDAWVLYRRAIRKRGVAKTHNLGRFTGPRHVLQCDKKLKLPKAAKAELEVLAAIFEGGDRFLEMLPDPSR